MNTKDRILAELRTGPMSDADLANALSMPVPTIRRNRGEMMREGAVSFSSKVNNIAHWQIAPKKNDKPLKPAPVTNVPGPQKRPIEVRAPGNTIYL